MHVGHRVRGPGIGCAALLAIAVLATAQRAPVTAPPEPSTQYRSADAAINQLGRYLGEALRANERSFRGRSGPVRAFAAGRAYPQIWLRDSAIIMRASRYHFSREHLVSWIDEHLTHQAAGGSLFDWIAAGPPDGFARNAPRARQVYGARGLRISADKNTVEADQESSGVMAAAQAMEILGDRAWLRAASDGSPRIERLDRALRYLLRDRFDARYGLVTSGLAADWGDISPGYADQRAIYLDERTPLVVGLYTNVLFARAADRLGALFEGLGDRDRAAFWRARASTVAASLNRHLWQADRGFYRMHLVLTPERLAGPGDDGSRFAMASNGLAALYGIADEAQARRIFAAAEARQRDYGMSTISGTLYPPFPSGFFRHPALRDPFSYQNGGQWDWFGGQLVLAEFERGRAGAARRHLAEIAAKAVSNNGLSEWHTPRGRGRGSTQYAASAGALAAAVYEGFFGVYLTAGRLQVTVRLGSEPGEITVVEPATGQRVSYVYEYDGKSRVIRFRFQSTVKGTGNVTLRVPEGRRPRALRIDGRTRRFTEKTIGDDRYVGFETDWRPHSSEIAFE